MRRTARGALGSRDPGPDRGAGAPRFPCVAAPQGQPAPAVGAHHGAFPDSLAYPPSDQAKVDISIAVVTTVDYNQDADGG